MIFIILIVIVIIVAIVVYLANNTDESHKASTYNNATTNYRNSHMPRRSINTIQDCISNSDLRYNIDTKQKQLEAQVEKNRQLVEDAKRQGYLTVSTAWMNRFNQLVEVSNTLNQNLLYENKRRLLNDKFHRYTDLHFRSMIMGNLAYEDYLEAKKGRDQISNVLLSIGQKKIRVSYSDKEKLYQIKDMYKESTSFLYDRMKSINNETGKLRDKIGSECGERGRKWWNERMKGHN